MVGYMILDCSGCTLPAHHGPFRLVLVPQRIMILAVVRLVHVRWAFMSLP